MFRRVRCAVLALALILVPAAVDGQDQEQKRDAKALLILQQSFGIMGGATPSDSILSGTVEIVAGSKSEQGRVRILARGLDQVAEELDTEDGRRVLIHSKGAAALRQGYDLKKLPVEEALSTQAVAAPSVVIAAALMNPGTNYEYIAEENLGGVPAHRIRFWNSFATRENLRRLAEFTVRDIWIDASSGLPVKLAFEQRAGGGAADRMDVEIAYSDYRQTGASVIPFRMVVIRNGVTWKTISIEQVKMNAGLSESEFQVR